jgi:hypothetical protein
MKTALNIELLNRQARLREVQLRWHPDSKFLSVAEALQWMDEPGPHQMHVARCLALCLQHDARVFYECGKRADGTYAWRGCRYGTEGADYISGFGRY